VPADSIVTMVNSLQNRVNSITPCITLNAKKWEKGIQIIITPKVTFDVTTDRMRHAVPLHLQTAELFVNFDIILFAND